MFLDVQIQGKKKKLGRHKLGHEMSTLFSIKLLFILTFVCTVKRATSFFT
uniref:Uncharacterized protein n=1 Tax=Rhizophora mucronata TaxID=61149 RepID=A0A2P2PTA2_RHIMU